MTETSETRWARLDDAGRKFFTQGDLARAEEAFQAAIRAATGPDADVLQLATSLGNLGQLRYRQRDFDDAESLFKRALELREQAVGAEHLSVVQSINNLAALHYARGDLAQAEPLFRRALSISESHLGDRHPDLAVNLNNLAKLYVRLRDFASAAPLLLRLLSVRESLHGPHHPEVASVLVMLSRARSAIGVHDDAEQLCRRALEIQEAYLSPDDPALAGTRKLLDQILTARPKPRVTPEPRVSEAPLEDIHTAPPARAPSVSPDTTLDLVRSDLTPERAGMPDKALPPLSHSVDDTAVPFVDRAVAPEPAPPPSLTSTPPAPFRIALDPIEPQPPLVAVSFAPTPAPAPPPATVSKAQGFVPSDDWSLDPREIADAPAGSASDHSADPSPEPLRPHVDHPAHDETPVSRASVAAKVELRSDAPLAPRPYAGAEVSDDDVDEAAALVAAELRARGTRRRASRWQRPESGRPLLIAAGALLVVLTGGYVALGRGDADAGTPPPVVVEEVAPEPQRPILPDFDRRLPAHATQPSDPTTRTDAAISDIPPGSSTDQHLYGGDQSDLLDESVPLPRVRIQVDGVSRAIARTKARVDSVGREIPSEPIQFQRPTARGP